MFSSICSVQFTNPSGPAVDTRDKCIVRPGAKVVDIDKVIRAEMGRCKPEAIIVQVGVNDIGPRRSEKLQSIGVSFRD